MPKDLGTLGGVTRDEFSNRADYRAQDRTADATSDRPAGIKYRIIDWPRAITLTFVSVFGLPILIVSLTGTASTHGIGLVVWIVVIAAIIKTHFSGLVFDLDKDRLLFPTLLFRRSIQLSEIRDANAEYIHRSFKANSLDTPINPSRPKETVRMPIYAANLSGSFGARQVKFWSKKRRDQFLGELQNVVPGVRVTRWW